MTGDLDPKARHPPWCSIVLVLSATACNFAVLVGNRRVAAAIDELGDSADGWSRVGLGVAHSLQDELAGKMHEASEAFFHSLEHVGLVQDKLDMVLSLMGNVTDAVVADSDKLVLLQSGGTPAGPDHRHIGAALTPVIMRAVHKVMVSTMGDISVLLARLLLHLKPALEQIGRWILTFGNDIQAGLSMFSETLDRVQKLFDQVMGRLHDHSHKRERMLEEVFDLFDANHNGHVSASDLHEVAEVFSITELRGNFSRELVATYGQLVGHEWLLDVKALGRLLDDPALPGAAARVLRTYAQRLSEVAGQVALSRYRSEVAFALVQYLGVVFAKNLTKVHWVSEQLGNGSLPTEFTACVMAQLCLNEDDPNKLVSASIGELAIAAMNGMHPSFTRHALDMMANTTFWDLEGFNIDDQPMCVERITRWLSKTKAHLGLVAAPMKAVQKRNRSLIEVSSSLNHLVGAAHYSPAAARRLAEERLEVHVSRRAAVCQDRRGRLLASGLAEVLGGAISSRIRGERPAAEQAAVSGQLASSDTLEFARQLSDGAAATAKEYHDMAFVSSSASSNGVDSFATKLQGLTSQVEKLLDLMMDYSTPEAIDRLERQFLGFVNHSMKDISRLVEKRLAQMLNESEPVLEEAIRKAAHTAGEKLRHEVGEVIESPLGLALADPLAEVVGKVVKDANQSGDLGRELGESVSESVVDLTAESMGDAAGDLVERFVAEALERGAAAVNQGADRLAGVINQTVQKKGPEVGLLELVKQRQDAGDEAGLLALVQESFRAEEEADGIPEAFAGGWEFMVNMLNTLAEKLPMAVSSLALATREVSKLHAALGTAFAVFEARGPPIFSTAAERWRTVWALYFAFLLPVNLLVLYYSFWAQGYFGGPAPFSKEEEEAAEHPQTWRQCFAVAFRSCLWRTRHFHDTQLCLWSALLFLQAVVAVLFLAAVLLSVMAGVEVFAGDGCSQIYILGDSTLCTDALENLRAFLERFEVFRSTAPLSDACGQNALLTCRVITQRMKVSTVTTAAFSFLCAVLSVQLLIDSAIHHERACYRRLSCDASRQEAVGESQ